jgi:hypothetical protein
MAETHEEKQETGQPDMKGFFGKHGAEIGLAVFLIYVILLILGVTAEIFKIQWILDWWIFQPPGR